MVMCLYPALQFDPIAAILFLPFLFLYSMLSATVRLFAVLFLSCWCVFSILGLILLGVVCDYALLLLLLLFFLTCIIFYQLLTPFSYASC